MRRQLKRLAGSTADHVSRLFFDPLYPSEQIDPALAARLRDVFHRMPPAEVQSDSRVEDEWHGFRQQLRTQFAASPEAFIRREPVRTLLGMGNSMTALAAWKYLRQSSLSSRYLQVLREDSVGKPIRFLLKPSSSGTQIHHTFHLCTFEERTQTRINHMKFVVEFGGGYGSFCRQAHRLGFAGKYLIFDLPELSAVQAYFLESLGYRILHEDQWADPTQPGVALINSVRALQSVVDTLRKSLAPSLFVATWSLSEVPRDFREEILAIVGELDHSLIAYQTSFGSVSNREFFSEMIRSRGGEGAWHHFPVYANPSSYYVIR